MTFRFGLVSGYDDCGGLEDKLKQASCCPYILPDRNSRTVGSNIQL